MAFVSTGSKLWIRGNLRRPFRCRFWVRSLCGKTKTDYDVIVIPEPSSIESKEVTKNQASEATAKKSRPAGSCGFINGRVSRILRRNFDTKKLENDTRQNPERTRFSHSFFYFDQFSGASNPPAFVPEMRSDFEPFLFHQAWFFRWLPDVCLRVITPSSLFCFQVPLSSVNE